jgi:hypothetical protein
MLTFILQSHIIHPSFTFIQKQKGLTCFGHVAHKAVATLSNRVTSSSMEKIVMLYKEVLIDILHLRREMLL